MLLTPPVGPYGGNLSVSTWTLGSFYEQWQLFHNQWSRTNADLDLVKYHGTKLRFWRNPHVDYIVTYSRNSPFKVTELTHPACQPFVMLLSRHKLVVPSLRTKPKGKPYKSLFIKPPRMLTQKFYFQSDFCPVGLFMLSVSACNLQDPWIDPNTISPCITFYALKNSVYLEQSITNPSEQLVKLTAISYLAQATYNTQAERYYHLFVEDQGGKPWGYKSWQEIAKPG